MYEKRKNILISCGAPHFEVVSHLIRPNKESDETILSVLKKQIRDNAYAINVVEHGYLKSIAHLPYGFIHAFLITLSCATNSDKTYLKSLLALNTQQITPPFP